MQYLFRRFQLDEQGAVTVDWVVLTAAIVGLSIGVIAIMGDGPVNIGNAVSSRLANSISVENGVD